MCYRPMQIIEKYLAAEQLLPHDPPMQQLQTPVKRLITDKRSEKDRIY